MTRKNILLLVLSGLLVMSCKVDPLDVDVSQVKVDIKYIDVNEVVMNADSATLIAKHQEYKENITDIYSYLTGYCMGIGDVSDTAFQSSIAKFRADTTIEKLHKNIDKKFHDRKDLEANITDGFRHLKYHVNSTKIPTNILFMNSLFRSGVFCTETEIGIGLEQFLGKENEIIQLLPTEYYFDWMKEGMDERYLERDVLTGWISTHNVPELEGNLAEHIIRWGKILYLTEAAFPDKEVAIILRYSKEDYNWALENEYPYWKYLVDENLLFKNDDKLIRNMVGDGPFTPGLPDQEGPDRLGQFLGWRMVHMYMDKKDVTVEQMVNASYNDILQEFEID